MVARLPLELDQMVIAESVRELGVVEAQRTRVVLSLVCRAWRDSIKLDEHLVVVGADNVKQAGRKLAKPKRAERVARVKSAHIELSEVKGRAKAESVVSLLRLLTNVESIELVTTTPNLRYGSFSVLGTLATLPKVSSFVCRSRRGSENPVQFDNAAVINLLGSWPNLRTLDLAGCRIKRTLLWTAPTGPFAPATQLNSLKLGNLGWWNAPRNLFAQLPATLESLSLDCTQLRNPSSSLSDLSPFPSSIRHLTILDDLHGAKDSHPAERGRFETLIQGATGLLRLTISPAAVSNLSASLAPLANLAELELVQTRPKLWAKLPHDEVIAFINSPITVDKITLSARIHKRWARAEQRAVADAAAARSVRFVIASAA